MYPFLFAASLAPFLLGMQYGPLWGLIALFSALGLLFIVKAMECMGVGLWDLLRSCKPQYRRRSGKRKQEGNQIRGEAIWETTPAEVAIAGISEAGQVLFPGQASLAETLSLAYSSEDVDEALFSLCCEQELEDILEEAAEKVGEAPGKQPLPLSFLPLVTESDSFSLSFPKEKGVGDSLRTVYQELQERIPFVLEFEEPLEDIEKEGASEAENDSSVSVVSSATGREPVDSPSIFEELIAKCDSEAKLALLPELPAIADNKELALLEKLSADPDKRVRKLARKLGTALRSRLEREDSSNSAAGKDELPMGGDITGNTPDAVSDRISLEYCFLEAGSRKEPPVMDSYKKAVKGEAD